MTAQNPKYAAEDEALATSDLKKKREYAKAKARRAKQRMEVLNHYGNNDPKCACCSERRIEFLAIDHINGGGNAHRREMTMGGEKIVRFLRKMGMPLGYRLLCHNCNLAMGTLGYCPHMTEVKRDDTESF